MSAYPCSICRQRSRGPLHHAYPAIYGAGNKRFARVRLCNEHLHELCSAEKWGLVPVELASDTRGEALCTACERIVPEGTETFVVPVFEHGRSRVDYVGELCTRCAGTAASYYRMASESILQVD